VLKRQGFDEKETMRARKHPGGEKKNRSLDKEKVLGKEKKRYVAEQEEKPTAPAAC